MSFWSALALLEIKRLYSLASQPRLKELGSSEASDACSGDEHDGQDWCLLLGKTDPWQAKHVLCLFSQELLTSQYPHSSMQSHLLLISCLKIGCWLCLHSWQSAHALQDWLKVFAHSMQDNEEILQEAMIKLVWSTNEVYSAGLPFNCLLYFKSHEISVKHSNLIHIDSAELTFRLCA